MSIAPRRLFWSLNCIGEKMILKMRLRMKGNAIMKAISPPHAIQNTFPNEMMIRIYRNVRTGPNTREGGDRDGFLRWEYRFLVVMSL
jgi:hypothetical protein